VSREVLKKCTGRELCAFIILCVLLLGCGASILTAASDQPSVNSGTIEGETTEETEGTEQTPPQYEYTEPEFDETRTSYPQLILRTVAVLAVIVVVIYLIFRFLLRSRNRIVSDTEMIKVLATFPLAANRLIKVVDIAGKILILGVTDANINLITEVEDKEIVDRIKLLSSKEGVGGGTFKDQFFKLLGGKGWSRTGETSYLRGYRDRINKMKKL
jgi:flagellar biogenesis protein FliO